MEKGDLGKIKMAKNIKSNDFDLYGNEFASIYQVGSCYPNRVTVINDCSHFIGDILPILTKNFDVNYVTRSRSLWSKTFGLIWKILCTHSDIYHVNFALQDAFLIQKLKHLDVLLCHGSDVRTTINSKKYGWMVRSNLRKAKKVLFSTPDLKEILLKYTPNPEYVPVPVRTDVFTPTTSHSKTLDTLYFKKWYEQIPRELVSLCRMYNINLNVIEPTVSYKNMPSFLNRFKIFIDRFTIPSFSKTCLEAMSCGLAAITYRDKLQLPAAVERLSDIDYCKKVGLENRQYVLENHDYRITANKITDVWSELLNES